MGDGPYAHGVGVVGSVQWILYLLVLLLVFGAGVWALVDAALRPGTAFTSAGKASKTAWVLILVGAVVLAFLTMPPGGPLAGGGFLVMSLSAVAVIVYFVDVRPAVAPYSRRRGGRGGSGGTPGGW